MNVERNEPVVVLPARVGFVYLLGVVALAGFFWERLRVVLSTTILTTARPVDSQAAESLRELIRWPLAFSAGLLLIITILLVLWIVWGQRLQQRRPRLALTLAIAAVLAHFVQPSLLAYWMFVHGGE